MKILLSQINCTIGDFSGITQRLKECISYGRDNNVDIIIFPELAACGYPPEDLLLHDEFIVRCEKLLQEVASDCHDIAAVVGIPRRSEDGGKKRLYNSAAVIADGEIVGFHDKVLLPTYDVFDERRYFESGGEIQLWSLAGKKVAVTICEDIWEHSEDLRWSLYKRDPVEELKELQPDLLINLSASPFSIGKSKKRANVCCRAAKTLGCSAVMCNQVGANDSIIFDGYSLCSDAEGRVVALGRGFEEELLIVDTEEKGKISNIEDHYPELVSELYDALVLGIHDYFKKQGISKACIGLSGGIDSSVVAALAVTALGSDNVLGVSMPSRYSSEGSRTDAQTLADNLGIRMEEIPIKDPFDTFLELLAPQFDGKPFDVAEENLQARIRGMLLMALSNKHGYLVLSTGNKSEMALGYSTLYGDTAGGLAVLSDLTKQLVYAVAHRINRDREVIPTVCITKPPSAELRPDQKDSDTLPPYEIIDTVLEEYVEQYREEEAIAEEHDFPLDLVKKIVKMVHRNEYKRRQTPPGLRVTEKAFSVGRCFPIVQKWK